MELSNEVQNKDKNYNCISRRIKMENILTIDDVAKKFQMSKSSIYKYSERNIIPSFKIGTCRRFFENEVEEYLKKITKEQRK